MSASASANSTTDHNQWKQFYDQHQTHQIVAPQTEGLLLSCDSTVMTAVAEATTTTMAAAASSESILSPKGSVAKPIRRRSRASKKTPTTLLNANTTNFRALVQQFTGCPNSSSSIMSLVGVHNKGPITLNFQQGSSSAARRTIIPSSFVVGGGGGGSGRGYYNDDHNQVQQQLAATTTTTNNNNTLLPWQKQQDHQLQGQESGYSFDEHVMKSYNDNNNNSSMGVSSDDHGLMMIMDNDFSLHDLTVNSNAFPNHDTY
ncbi:hypothetical protein PIB30_005235 [Stylosanthes scabra]|uniref:VQ domain-containing protein n=1 Tax=Stylosanthes scabra TaxID=79078 RepID=A0ABU6T3M8_9FABA|nr:hypothetical protein [Stylosanthes scabra]